MLLYLDVKKDENVDPWFPNLLPRVTFPTSTFQWKSAMASRFFEPLCYIYQALELIDLDPREISKQEFVEYFGGNRVLPGSDPAAHCYCGHQFGSFSGQVSPQKYCLVSYVYVSILVSHVCVCVTILAPRATCVCLYWSRMCLMCLLLLYVCVSREPLELLLLLYKVGLSMYSKPCIPYFAPMGLCVCDALCAFSVLSSVRRWGGHDPW